MRKSKGFALATVLLLLAILLPTVALAQVNENQQAYLTSVGNYEFNVIIDRRAINTGDDVGLQIRLATGSPPNSTTATTLLRAETLPGPGISATSLRINLQPTPDGQGWTATLNYPVSGRWQIRLNVGFAQGVTPLFSVSAPPAIPVWTAWLIALVPATFFVAFLIFLARRAGKRFRRETNKSFEL